MKTPHKHAEVIKAWADGAEIECRENEHRKWMTVHTPVWSNLTEYRVKPEPKPDIVTECKLLGAYKAVLWNSVTNTVPGANLKLTFDGETGKLKSAEVI